MNIFGDVVVHGQAYTDGEIKQLIDQQIGDHLKDWVYGDPFGRQSLDQDECNILVVYGEAPDEHITFVGPKGLNECIDFIKPRIEAEREPPELIGTAWTHE